MRTLEFLGKCCAILADERQPVYHLECKLCGQKFYLLFKYKIPQSRKSAALGVQDLYANPVKTAAEYILTPGALVYSSSWDSNNLVA